MSNIKIMDCTLRDGGYINNWDFSAEDSKEIIDVLLESLIDYVEIGFLTKKNSGINKTLFDSFSKIEKFLPPTRYKDRLFGMIKIGEFDYDLIPDYESSPIGGFRVIFRKNDIEKALDYCRNVKSKGYRLFINPTYVNQYSDNELLNLLNKCSEISPYAVSIVDSMGVMNEEEALRIYKLLDNNLDKNVSICCHFHNNLQLGFLNAKTLLDNITKRELIIDSTIFGMGRGAGNLLTENIAGYINEKFDGNYDTIKILKLSDEKIIPIYKSRLWGYSIPYYLSAKNYCHQDYAKFLFECKDLTMKNMDKIFNSIPEDKKTVYDEALIKKIYTENFDKN